MNERIQELMIEAGKTIPGDKHIDADFCEKFAELIVRECSKISEDDVTDGDACCTNTAYRIARQIKRHFGVEESKREKIDRAMREAFKDGVDLSGKETP
jgi:hypothetical protein